ncbi:MAG: flagellar biosynthesis protein FlgA, partial [Rhodoferax sp.]|nr:flagellar biosynthesis protein FlgA [Rhodoferax sp.]
MFKIFFNPTRQMPTALGLVVALCFTLSTPTPAFAQADGGKPEFIATTQRWLDNAVSNIRPAGAAPLRMEVAVGELDSRLRPAPCARLEPTIPVRTLQWGKTRLGLRCLQGSAK